MSVFALAAVLALSPGAVQQSEPAPKARTHLIVGELIRLDLERSRVTIKTRDPRREVVVEVTSDTRIVSRGRVRAIEDVETGVAASVVCEQTDPETHVATLLRFGGPPDYSRRRSN